MKPRATGLLVFAACTTGPGVRRSREASSIVRCGEVVFGDPAPFDHASHGGTLIRQGERARSAAVAVVVADTTAAAPQPEELKRWLGGLELR